MYPDFPRYRPKKSMTLLLSSMDYYWSLVANVHSGQLTPKALCVLV